MSRVARVVVPGYAHHITQRGNRGVDVFEDAADYEAYLKLLGIYLAKYRVRLWAYCLMANHVHLVAVPKTETGLGLALRDTHGVYAMRYNSRTQMSGHVWQGRFFSCPLDSDHAWAAVRYVERNPVRAGMVGTCEEYTWSSAQAHCGQRVDGLLDRRFPSAGSVDDWASWLLDEHDDYVERLRRNTHVGRPCGSARFIRRLERRLQRPLRPQKRGRKPKPTEEENKNS